MHGEVVFVDAPVIPRMESGLVRFDLHSGEETLHCAMSVHDFLQSFAHSAVVAKGWRGGDVVEIGTANTA